MSTMGTPRFHPFLGVPKNVNPSFLGVINGNNPYIGGEKLSEIHGFGVQG